MKPSTSLGTRSKVGMVNPSPLVRQAGNIRGLLRIHELCRRNILRSCSHVKDSCRCRDTSCGFVESSPDQTMTQSFREIVVFSARPTGGVAPQLTVVIMHTISQAGVAAPPNGAHVAWAVSNEV